MLGLRGTFMHIIAFQNMLKTTPDEAFTFLVWKVQTLKPRQKDASQQKTVLDMPLN